MSVCVTANVCIAGIKLLLLLLDADRAQNGFTILAREYKKMDVYYVFH